MKCLMFGDRSAQGCRQASILRQLSPTGPRRPAAHTLARSALALAALLMLPLSLAAQQTTATRHAGAHYVQASGESLSSPASVSAAMDRLAVSPPANHAPGAGNSWGGRFPAANAPVISARESAPPQNNSATRKISINTMSSDPRLAVTVVSPTQLDVTPSGHQQVSYDAPARPTTIPNGSWQTTQRQSYFQPPHNSVALTPEEAAQLRQLELAEQQLSDR